MNASEVGEWGGERKGGGSDMREVFLWEGGGGGGSEVLDQCQPHGSNARGQTRSKTKTKTEHCGTVRTDAAFGRYVSWSWLLFTLR